jgi:phage FluMu protein Com
MCNDTLVLKKCSKCKTINEFNLSRDANAFDCNSAEHWDLLSQVYQQEIHDCKSYYFKLAKSNIVTDEEVYTYIAEQLKFNTDAFNFCHCSKCNKPLMFYIFAS